MLFQWRLAAAGSGGRSGEDPTYKTTAVGVGKENFPDSPHLLAAPFFFKQMILWFLFIYFNWIKRTVKGLMAGSVTERFVLATGLLQPL